jgi:hypothetical protein
MVSLVLVLLLLLFQAEQATLSCAAVAVSTRRYERLLRQRPQQPSGGGGPGENATWRTMAGEDRGSFDSARLLMGNLRQAARKWQCQAERLEIITRAVHVQIMPHLHGASAVYKAPWLHAM